MHRILIFLNLLFIQFSIFPQAKKITLRLCANDVRKSVDPNATYEAPNIDIFKYAVANLKNKLNITYSISFMPMDRCIYSANRGDIDAVLDISFTDERALVLDYPPGSGPSEINGPCTAELKMSCSRYLVLTPKKSDFIYKGNKKELPFPIRASLGYSITKKLVADFQENVELSKNDIICIKKMIRDKNGCVIANFGYIPGMVENKLKDLLPKVNINKVPYDMRSNYIPFAKKSEITTSDRMIFWKELSSILNDPVYVKKIRNKYTK